jgi:DnaD/phage-associated family protein
MKREQFTFYRSYYEAIKTLPAKELKSVLLAICSYALDEEVPVLSGISNSVFVLIRPTLDSGRKKAENRVNKRGTKREQNENKTEQNRKESEGEREVEREVEVEREDDMSISIIPVIPSAREAPPASPPSKTSASVGYFLHHINASASGECLRELLGYEQKLGSDVCIYAMRYAIDEKKTAWSYIRAILAAYVRDGVKSVDDIKRRDMQRGQRPTGKNAARNAQYSTHGGSVSDLERKAIEAALREGGA